MYKYVAQMSHNYLVLQGDNLVIALGFMVKKKLPGQPKNVS